MRLRPPKRALAPLLLVALAFAAVAPAGVFGSITPHSNTHGSTWLLTRHARVFCGAVPDVPTMEVIEPSEFTPPCSHAKYSAALAPAWLPSVFMGGAAVVALGLVCRALCCRESRRAVGEHEFYVSVKATFADRPREDRMAVGLAGGVIALACITIALVGSDQVRTLSVTVQTILRATYEQVDGAVLAVNGSLAVLGVADTAASLVAEAHVEASVYRDNTDFYLSQLQESDALRRALMFLCAIGLAVVTVGGTLAVQMRSRQTASVLVVVGLLVLVALWGNFAIYSVGANVLSDMCVTVNECDECVAPGACPACNVGWYAAAQGCEVGQAHRFKSLRDFVIDERAKSGLDVCALVSALCALPELSCVDPIATCDEASVLHEGLTTVVCPNATASDCASIASLNTSSYEPAVANATAAVLAEYARLELWNSAHDTLSSLDCNKTNAFLTSPSSGTYAQLRQTLCPRGVFAANPPQSAIGRTALGVLLAALVFPVTLASLWLAVRPSQRTTTASITQFAR